MTSATATSEENAAPTVENSESGHCRLAAPGTVRPMPFKVRALALLLSAVVRLLHATLHVTVQGERDFETVREKHGSVILVTWHGQSLIPVAHRRGRGYTGLVSLSRDGELLTEYFRRMNWRTIRGSTGRGGARAAIQAVKMLKSPGMTLSVTPDGPRGPARKVQPGVVFLAKMSGKPLIPVGIHVRRAWHARSWDRFVIPKPFSRVMWLYGDPIFVGSEEDTEAMCLRIEEAINRLEAQAAEGLGKAPHASH